MIKMTSSESESRLVEVADLNFLFKLSEVSSSVEADARVLFRASGIGGLSEDISAFQTTSTVTVNFLQLLSFKSQNKTNEFL